MEKKLLLMMGLSSAFVASQAQTVVAKLGFENGDEKMTTEYALTPNIGNIYGDWVNVKETDSWTEQSKGAHSGEYCFCAENGGSEGFSWDRGFKIGVPAKMETPYRVSFWVKADPTFVDENGDTQNTKLTSWLSKGMENFDKSCVASDGTNFGVQMTSGLTGDWQRISFVSFTPSREVMKSIVDGQSWVGSAAFPTQFGGGGETYKEHFDGEIPEMYFFIANMFSPVTYYIDDILVEEGVTVLGATHNAEVIKINFGYKTNLAELAKKNKGTLVVDPSTAKVTLNGEEIDVDYVEGKEDGYLYVFCDAEFEEDDDVKVSFTGDDRILYTAAARPSTDVTGDVVVMGCTNESASFEEFDVEALAWSAPMMVSSVPANYEFSLKAEDVKNISITFNTKVDVKKASVSVEGNGKVQSATMAVAEDGKTVKIDASDVKFSNGEYKVVLKGVTNNIGYAAEDDIVLTFTVGTVSGGDIESIVAYKSDFENYDVNMLPPGWSGRGDDQDRIGSATETFSGAPRLMGGADAPGHGIYLCQRGGTNSGLLAFGKYAAQGAALSEDGKTLAEGVTEAEALYLKAGEYQLSYKMATWEGLSADKKYTGVICNANDEVIYSIDEQSPESNVQNASEESIVKEMTYDFAVDTDGYYYVEFEAKNGWGGLILTKFSVTSKASSSASYYIQLLENAIEDAEGVLTGASEDYDGATKTALADAIEKAKTGSYTTPDAITAIVDDLTTKSQALVSRINNYKDFVKGFESAKAKYEELDGKYKNSDVAHEVENVIADYSQVDPKTLADAELADIASKVKTLSSQIDNVTNIVNVLTYRAEQALNLALYLGVTSETADKVEALATDDSALIDALNKENTIAFYKEVAKDAYLDLGLDEKIYYNSGEALEEIPEDGNDYDENGYALATQGINFNAYIKNPKFYTVSRGGNFQNGEADLPGWVVEQVDGEADEEGNVAGFAGTVHFSGDAASDSKPVSDIMINNFGASDYSITQVVEGLPVGVYDFRLDTRTYSDGVVTFNAQDENGVWDKYIFAQVDDEEPVMAPFAVGGYQQVRVTVAKGIKVKEGSKVKIGVVEKYNSGLAEKNGEPTTGWDTNTWADDAAFYFVAPLEGYDYAAAADKLATGVDAVASANRVKIAGIYRANGVKVVSLQKGINIVKMSDGTTRKIVK